MIDMSIKTKKINDLTKIEVSNGEVFNGLNFVCSSGEVTGRVTGETLANIINSATTSALSTIQTGISEDSEVISTIKSQLKDAQSKSSLISTKQAEMLSRINDLETKYKSLSKAVSDLSLDTSNHIIEMKATINKMCDFFSSLVYEEKLTISKIQEAAKTVVTSAEN